MTIIKEIKTTMSNNETKVCKGVYQNADGTYTWLTYTRSGECKTLATALKKAGF